MKHIERKHRLPTPKVMYVFCMYIFCTGHHNITMALSWNVARLRLVIIKQNTHLVETWWPPIVLVL